MDDQKNVMSDRSRTSEDSILYKKTVQKTEWEKLKELHGKDKAWYLLQYYGLQTLIALVLIAVVGYVVIHYVTQKNIALQIMAVNAVQSENNPALEETYYTDFLTENGLDPKENTVLVSCDLGATTNPDDSASVESIQMIQSRFMTGSVDVFFSDYDFFYSLGEFDYLADIRDYLPDEVLEKYKEDLVYVKSAETGKEYPIGITLKQNAWVKETGWYQDSSVVGLAEGLKDSDLAVKFIEKVLEN